MIVITLILTVILATLLSGTSSAENTIEIDSMDVLKVGIIKAIQGQVTVMDFAFSEGFSEDLTAIELGINFDEARNAMENNFDKYNVYRMSVSYDASNKTGTFSIEYFNSEANIVEVDIAVDLFLAGLDMDLTQSEKAKAVYDYILSAFKYGESTEVLERNLMNGLNGGLVVCQSYALLASKMLSEAGLINIMILGDVGRAHIWNMVNIDGKWYHFDATWGDTSPGHESRFFLTSSDVLDETHNWITGDYPIADSVYH
jgi:hypothetical protein